MNDPHSAAFASVPSSFMWQLSCGLRPSFLESGRIMMDGPAKALAENKDVKEFYLGISSEGQELSRHEVVPPPQALGLKCH